MGRRLPSRTVAASTQLTNISNTLATARPDGRGENHTRPREVIRRATPLMKTTITIQDGDVRLQLSPETDIEKMTMRELGDEISVSRSHESMVLRPRAKAQNVRKISDRLAEVEAPTG